MISFSSIYPSTLFAPPLFPFTPKILKEFLNGLMGICSKPYFKGELNKSVETPYGFLVETIELKGFSTVENYFT